jgi:hypothetical protein
LSNRIAWGNICCHCPGGVEELAMRKIIGGILVLMASAGFAAAGIGAAPEIDPTAAVGALALLGGGALVIRGRRRKQ